MEEPVIANLGCTHVKEPVYAHSATSCSSFVWKQVKIGYTVVLFDNCCDVWLWKCTDRAHGWIHIPWNNYVPIIHKTINHISYFTERILANIKY
jgi:hypothetical protein